MFALVQKYLGRIGQIRNEDETVATLKDICADLGFRSVFMMEFSLDTNNPVSFFDTDPSREGWFARYREMTSGEEVVTLQEMLKKGGVQYRGEGRFPDKNDPVRALIESIDMLEVVMVPVRFDEDVAGLAGFSGWPQLTQEQQTTLQVLVYALFSQVQKMRTGELSNTEVRLTPREREVMSLAVGGLTSTVIAARLKLSARTVNQHVENVALKLGTKNRVHTAAEVVRNRLLEP